MRINNNLMAMNTHRQLGINSSNGAKSIEKLSSGYRINRAGDDAAGLAISEKMRGQIRGLGQASRNAQDGISLIQTAEGALTETHAILQRMNELSTQAANDTNVLVDRSAIQDEITELNSEIDRISKSTQFNEKNLLDGTLGVQLGTSGLAVGSDGVTGISIAGAKANETYTITTGGAGTYTITETSSGDTQNVALADSTAGVLNFDNFGIKITVNGTQTAAGIAASTAGTGAAGTIVTGAAAQISFQIGAKNAVAERMGVQIAKIDSSATSLNTTSVSVVNAASARTSMDTVQAALNTVSTERAKLGAYQNRLEYTIKNLDTSAENLQAAESRIRDVDMAKEMMNFTKNNILQQAAQAMLAQANQQPQGVLQLLR